MEHKGTITIETERLVLRAFVIEDVPFAYANWESDDKVTKFLRWQTYHSMDAVKEVIAEWIENYTDKSFYQWAIVLKEINEPIGATEASWMLVCMDCWQKIILRHRRIGYVTLHN